jgi:hypothetical protein
LAAPGFSVAALSRINHALFVLPACVQVHETRNALQSGPVRRP